MTEMLKTWQGENAEAPTHHKEHLPLILVRQQEETEDGGVGNLVVKRLTVQVEESRIDSNIIPVEEAKGEMNGTQNKKSSFKYHLIF